MLGGLAMLAWAAARDAAVRAWALAFGVPLLLTTAVCVLTLSITMAAPWRTIGIWALLLPFEALAILRLADRLGRSGARRRGLALAVLLVVALLPPAARSAVYVREGMLDSQTGAWREDRAAGLHVVRELGRSDAKALLDSAGNLEFLDVLGGSGAPERLVLSHGTDPQVVANKAPFHGPAPPDPSTWRAAAPTSPWPRRTSACCCYPAIWTNPVPKLRLSAEVRAAHPAELARRQ
jgi:hypothetical protein